MFGQGPTSTGYDGRIGMDSFAATIATFEVSDSAVVAEDLPVYALNRPCYVASTLDEDEALMTQRSLKFSMPRWWGRRGHRGRRAALARRPVSFREIPPRIGAHRNTQHRKPPLQRAGRLRPEKTRT